MREVETNPAPQSEDNLTGETKMKRIFLLAAVVASAITPATAFAAPTANSNVQLNATVANTCAIRGITGSPANATLTATGESLLTNASGSDALAGASLAFTNTSLFNSTTAATNAIANALTVSAFCNYATHNVGLQSANGGLIASGTAPTTAGTFAERVNYTAVLSAWGAVTSTLDTTAATTTRIAAETNAPPVIQATPVNTNTATLVITTKAYTTHPALAGAYTDTLRIRLGASF